RRAVGGIRQAVTELEQAELLGGQIEARREAGVVQQPPEVVARVGEVRGGRRGHAPRVDPAEDAVEVGREDVGDVAGARGECGHAAYSVADTKPRSPCRPTSSAATVPGGPSPACRSDAATSSSGTRESRGLVLALQAPEARRLRLAPLVASDDP